MGCTLFISAKILSGVLGTPYWIYPCNSKRNRYLKRGFKSNDSSSVNFNPIMNPDLCSYKLSKDDKKKKNYTCIIHALYMFIQKANFCWYLNSLRSTFWRSFIRTLQMENREMVRFCFFFILLTDNILLMQHTLTL